MTRILVDEEKCVGGGQCVMAAPAVFDQDDDTGTVVLLDPEPGPEYDDDVRQAARLCPAVAITVATP
ncbi:ferredoxin [Jiangella alkaliphila]|uniref:Ferredoxin n=1 Tax=Jiangella alkaliphila TaxID=419479 RepID=A0A1H2J754_9ACTN|nr:ferredoxin [Jiangella alkaliphila]SDU52001.1 Ferredoxin [Jiangella alkaliphila]